MTTIYWFSGTGNSLAVAREIAGGLSDASLTPISAHRGRRVQAQGAVGIVCPVYFYGMPLVVRDFVHRLDLAQASYVFVVLTSGGFPGNAPRQAHALVRGAGRAPDAVFSVPAPGNYIAMYDVPAPAVRERLLVDARRMAQHIASGVRSRERASVETTWAARAAYGLLSATFGRGFATACRGKDRRFLATESCTRCGLCARACPVANIELRDGRPHWLGHCEQCFACVHWCPAAAIQIRGAATAKRGRYHHPDVSIDEIASQQTSVGLGEQAAGD